MKIDKHGLSTLPMQYPYAINSLPEHQFFFLNSYRIYYGKLAANFH